MLGKDRQEIFTDKWQYRELPKTKERSDKLDYSHMAAIGSCFARNLYRWLNFRGYANREAPWGILYNPFSIQKEIERLYSPVEWEQNILMEVSNDGEERVRDPWRTWHVFSTTEELKEANQKFDRLTRGFLENSNGFLITLGLSEVWSRADRPEVVFNQVPIGSIRRRQRSLTSRFSSVLEAYEALEKTVNLIREHITQSRHIIFTLSPVPLKYTASGIDIREANNLSKATLLVALKELIANRSDVDYFPSYEIVQALAEQPNNTVWQVDGRHVSAQVVEVVATKFIETYGKPEGKDNVEKFWVPRVDEAGRIVGKLYVDGTYVIDQ